jgi:hypothetical protein
LVNNFNTRAEKYVENQVGNDIGLHITHLGKTSLSGHQSFIIDQISGQTRTFAFIYWQTGAERGIIFKGAKLGKSL